MCPLTTSKVSCLRDFRVGDDSAIVIGELVLYKVVYWVRYEVEADLGTVKLDLIHPVREPEIIFFVVACFLQHSQLEHHLPVSISSSL